MTSEPTANVDTGAHHYPGPDKCVVFWDYENISVPRGCPLRNVIAVLKQRIWSKIGPKEIPIQFRLYIRASKLNDKLQEALDINGIEHINIASKKPESVDKRMLIDIALHLYELEKYKRSNAIALISGDKDFGHLLSRIHKEPPISHSLLILWQSPFVSPDMSNNVDFVINDFNSCSFRVCPNAIHCQQSPTAHRCLYYHPTDAAHDITDNWCTRNDNAHLFKPPIIFNKAKKKKKRKHNRDNPYTVSTQPSPKRSKKSHPSYTTSFESLRFNPYLDGGCPITPETTSSSNARDSDIEVIEINAFQSKKDNPYIRIQLAQTEANHVESIDISLNDTVNDILRYIHTKYKAPKEAVCLSLNGQQLYKHGAVVNRDLSIDESNTIAWSASHHDDMESTNYEAHNDEQPATLPPPAIAMIDGNDQLIDLTSE